MNDSNSQFSWWSVPMEAYLLTASSFVAMVVAIYVRFEDADIDNVLFGTRILTMPLLVLGFVGYLCSKLSQYFQINTTARYGLFLCLLALSLFLGKWVGRAIDF